MAQELGLLPGWSAMWAVQRQLQTTQMFSVPVFFSRHLSQVRDTAPDWAGAESTLGTLLRATASKPALLLGKVQAEVLALSQRNN